MINWSKMTPNEIASALRTIPRQIAHAWRYEERLSAWVRDDADEYGVAYAAMITQDGDKWKGPPIIDKREYPDGFSSINPGGSARYETLEGAKTAYDHWLRQNGWLIDDTTDGSDDESFEGRKIIEIRVGDEIVKVTEGKFDDGTRVWWECR